MATHSDVLIIGGGVIGLTIAYYLAREGAAVEVVDKSDFGQESSWAGAGILPPGNPAQARTPLHQLRAHSAAMFPAFAAELRERTGIDTGYLRCGGLELSDELKLGEDESQDEWRSEGIVAELLKEKQLHALEPCLSPRFGRAYFLPDMAQVRNPWHLKALIAGCATCGVRLRPGCPVTSFEHQGERAAAIKTGIETLSAGQFLIAAGAWADGLLEQVGWQRGIRPVRGQIALLRTDMPLFRRILVAGSRYLVPRPDGRVLVGSTEEDVGFDKRTTAVAITELLAFAYELVPALANAHVERCWAGLRPGSPDDLPYLGPVPGFANLFVAAGHYRSGLQTSPATGLVMKELLLGQKLTIPLEPFRLDRS